MYIRGRPYTVTIDDYLPVYNGGLIFEAANSGDRNIWSALLEKAFAKVVGNYEGVNDGWQVESMRFFTGAPSYQYTVSSYSATSIFSMIQSAFQRGFNVGCDTSSYSNYNLVTSHAYHVLGAYQVTGSNGGVVANLYHVRNPWGMDYGYSGAWSDNGSAWTAAYKAQVPYVNNLYDGAFFVEATEFANAFYTFDINFIHDSWSHSYYEVVGDSTGAQRTFTFTLPSAQELYISADFYDPRMYANGCGVNGAGGSLTLYQGSTQLASASVQNYIGYGYIYMNPLNAGTYTIKFQPQWESISVRDYTIQVYAAIPVTILDSNGKNVFNNATVYLNPNQNNTTPNNNSTTTTTNTTTNTTNNNTTPTTPVTPVTPVAPTTITNATLNANLTTAIAKVSSGLYQNTNGLFYQINQGYYSGNEYFFQFVGEYSYLAMQVQVTLTSFNITMASTTGAAVTTTHNSDGSTSLTTMCNTSGLSSCSYLVSVSQVLHWSWSLVNFSMV
jgi:hypothetical protein